MVHFYLFIFLQLRFYFFYIKTGEGATWKNFIHANHFHEKLRAASSAIVTFRCYVNMVTRAFKPQASLLNKKKKEKKKGTSAQMFNQVIRG